ncbi:MAG: T9SS type A sorting domain-containing protein, partial [Bacteroidales bacterium]|nr:T9SS type A sorting domain-containing protein [Bacteroidales bacterium]
GVNNLLSGNYSPQNVQPVLFKSGGGFFSVNFDGKKLSWTVSSTEEDHKASMSANANSSSTKCGPDYKSASALQAAKGAEPELQPVDLIAYPNPFTDRINISMQGIGDYESIQVYDYSGKTHSVSGTVRNQDLLELDMSALPKGTYFIRIVIGFNSRIFTVIKK